MGTCPSKRFTNDDTIEDTGQEGDKTEYHVKTELGSGQISE